MFVAAVERQGPVDGALLHLHGAMVTESHEDGEGELLERLRQVLGGRMDPRAVGRHAGAGKQSIARRIDLFAEGGKVQV